MGSKRVGLARTQALIENLDRALALGGSDLTVESLTADNGVTATAGDITATADTLKIENGGSVTQASSKSTGVTLNHPVGKITMHAAALAADAIVSFTVTCSHARATDVCIVNHHSGGTVGAYSVDATGHASGAFNITVTNVSAGSLSQALVLHYALIKTAHT
jgi:hypothetical protein